MNQNLKYFKNINLFQSACAWIVGEFGEYIPKSVEKM